MTYQVVESVRGKTVYVNPVTETELSFIAKKSRVTVQGNAVEMVNFRVTANQQKPVGSPECSPCGSPEVRTSFQVTGNIPKGDTTQLSALRSVVIEALDEAILSHNIASGLVPSPSVVSFGS